jgi:hypothetical protein
LVATVEVGRLKSGNSREAPMRIGSIAMFCLAACGGSTPKPDAAVDIGFNKPTAALHANNEVSSGMWMDLGVADLTCLGTPSDDQATTVAVTLNTKVKDFESGKAVPQSTVTAFAGINFAQAFDTQTSDANGFATFTVPVGTKRFGFKMTSGTQLPTFLLNQLIKPTDAVQPTGTCDPAPCRMDVQSVSTSTGQLLPALIGEQRKMGTGVIAGALRDCQDHEMSNFIATVSTTKGDAAILTGAEAYYFSFSAGTDLPAHHSQQDASSADGLFMVIQLPPTDAAFVQMWGYPTDADLAADQLKLIAELQVPVLPDTVITGSYSPLRQ